MQVRTCVVLLVFGLAWLVSAPAQETGRWTAQAASIWYAKQPWMTGANYVPSDAINQLEMFQKPTWNPGLNDRELGLAESAGMNVMRVFLQDQLWQEDPKGFVERLDALLGIASKHEIRLMFVLFDSCWDPMPKLGPQHPPIPGVHNSGWVQSPGAKELDDPKYGPKLEAYVKGVVGAFAKDDRVLAWDVWNEPDNRNDGSYRAFEPARKVDEVDALLPKVFAWARSMHPQQPLTSAVWTGDWVHPDQESETTKIQLNESDFISFHNYGWPESFEARVKELMTYGRPVICSEFMARGAGSTFDGTLPVAKRLNVAAINWGLVAGKTQTWLPWDSWRRPYTLEPPVVWFHEVFHADGTPYRTHEVEEMRELTGRGKLP